MKSQYIYPSLAAASVLGAAFVAFACSAGAGSGGPGSRGGDGDAGPDIDLGDGDGSIDVPDGGNGGPGSSDNLFGLPTNVILVPECDSDCAGFSDPENADAPLVIVEEGVSADQVSTLDAGGPAGSLCVSEPAPGTIFPAAWTRPRFNAGVSGPAKITISAARMRHDAVFYSSKMPAIMPLSIWEAISRNVYNEDITYTIVTGGQQVTGTFQVVPAATGGSMVFWGSTGTSPGETTNALYGFGVGDEGVVRVLYPRDIQGTALDDNANLRNRDQGDGGTAGKSSCIGCHSSSPDGKAVASMDHWAYNVRVYSVEPGSEGAAPEWLTPAGAAMASMTWMGQSVFSEGDWAGGARRMVTTWAVRDVATEPWKTHDGMVLSNEPAELIWINLASTAEMPADLRAPISEFENEGQGLQRAVAALKGTDWEVIPRMGDTNSPVLPDWSNDGRTIVYTSTDRPQDGRVGGASVVDLYKVDFNAGQGGAATPVSGADTSDFEYYPAYSPDDELIAFNKLPFFTTNPAREDSFDHVYYRPDSEINVIAAGGGTPARLMSNDPICEGTAGQLYNSWAKWSPSTASGDGRNYYFLVFSTARNSPFDIARGDNRTSPASQLYMTTVIREADGTITSGAGIYVWNQRNLVSGEGDAASVSELLTNNVTPAWDEFQIPPVPPVIIR